VAVKVYIDTIETLAMKEKYGVVVAMTRRAVVTGLTGTSWDKMYAALDAAGLPGKGTFLEYNNIRSNHLILTDRDVQMVDKDKAEVILEYGLFNDRGQPLQYDGTVSLPGVDITTGQTIAGKMTTSVSQRTTNLFREAGVGEETLISVSHTYPEDDTDFGGRTIQQTGEVEVAIPQRTFTVDGVKQILAPWAMAEALVGAVNDRVWLGQAAHTWMCTEVSWEARAYKNYFMSFTFQHNPDTWNPTAVFIDERTEKPPPGLVAGTGYKYIRYHREVNFVRELGFYVVGPTQ